LVCLYIYSRLGAASKSLELYKELGVKQIQLDSCPFVILDVLKKAVYTVMSLRFVLPSSNCTMPPQQMWANVIRVPWRMEI
jgi:hypothetical protein